MQYWKPDGKDAFAGDMMPFWDGRRFHLFYLLDHHHHAEREGLGGHQWAHASTADLKEWSHPPLALPVGGPGDLDEKGICTGSIFAHEDVYHAFYATRLRRPDGGVSEVVCRAASRDLVRFDKSPDNPLFGAPAGLDPRNHRDPFVFRHPATGRFQMLVTASCEPGGGGERGVLAHYESPDLEHWHFQGPFLELDQDPCPECPEHFFWNGWWYLIYSQGGELQYRISRDPLGPWQRARRDTIEGPNLTVPRTAAFTGGRRLAVGFLPWRRDGRDDAGSVYAGSAVFRELVQEGDGTLSTRFVPEMMPQTGPPLETAGGALSLQDTEEGAWAVHSHVPADSTLSFRIVPEPGAGEYGVLLRADARLETGYRLGVRPAENSVTLHGWPEGGPSRARIDDLPGLGQGAEVVICMRGSVLDVCVNDGRTLVERGFDHQGTHLGLRAGTARLEDLHIARIL